MTYAVVFPPEIVAELYRIREETGVPIRRQIMNATKNWIELYKDLSAYVELCQASAGL